MLRQMISLSLAAMLGAEAPSVAERRALFDPERDKNGKPIEFTMRLAVRWGIPGCPSPKQSYPEIGKLRQIVTVT